MEQKIQGDVLYKLLSISGIGLPIFFVISGFVLSLPFAEHYLLGARRIDLKNYFLRRLTRLEPPYIISLLIYAATRVMLGGQSLAPLIPHLLASIFYYSNFAYPEHFPEINFVTWSLEIEVQFYIIAPLLAMLYLVRSATVRRLTISGIIVLSILALPITEHWPRSLAQNLCFFMAGYLLSEVYIYRWKRLQKRSIIWDLAGLTATVAMVMTIKFAPHAVTLAGIPFLFLAAFEGKYSNRFFTLPWITAIGGMCYTIYLYHALLLRVLLALIPGFQADENYAIGFIWRACVALPIMYALCAYLYLWFEQPFMRKDLVTKLRALLGDKPKEASST